MFKKEGMVSKIVGVVLLVVIVVLVIVIKNGNFTNKVDEIYGAVGGGKEDLLADEEINKIFAKKYKFKFVQDSWSNGKTVKESLVRKDGSKYDLAFFSDQRYYDYIPVDIFFRTLYNSCHLYYLSSILLKSSLLQYSLSLFVMYLDSKNFSLFSIFITNQSLK